VHGLLCCSSFALGVTGDALTIMLAVRAVSGGKRLKAPRYGH
jgi:hypothetical protein